MLGRRYINAKKKCNVNEYHDADELIWIMHTCKHKLHTQNASNKKYKQIIKGDLIEGGGEWNDHTNLMV